MHALIKKLNDLNIIVDLADEQLNIKAPQGAMTEELLQEIRGNKANIIEFIKKYKADSSGLVAEKIPVSGNQDDYSLSSQQYRLWLLHQMVESTTAYNMPNVYKISGEIEKWTFEIALKKLIERHEVLRTSFLVKDDGNVYQQIRAGEEDSFKLNYIEVGDEADVEEVTRTVLNEEIGYSFNFSKDSLVRVTLLKTSEQEYLLAFVLHHIVSDGWSASIIMRDLFSYYDAILKGNEPQLPDLTIQYKDYATWQQSLLKTDVMRAHKTYWINKFKGEIPILDFPGQKSRPSIKTYNGKTLVKTYSKETTERLKAFCKDKGATLFTGLLTTVKSIIFRYTGQHDLVLGIPFSGRDHIDLQQQVGFYVNTLPLRTTFADNESFDSLLAKVKSGLAEAQRHQKYPYDDLIKSLNYRFNRSRNPLFDIVVAFEEKEIISILESNGNIIVNALSVEDNTSKFDLEFKFREREGAIELALTYNTDIYNEEFIKQLVDHLGILTDKALKDSKSEIQVLGFLSSEEQHKLLYEFNATEVNYSFDKSYICIFRERVSSFSDNQVVFGSGNSLTFKELDDRSEELAVYLVQQFNAKKGDCIAVKMDRGEPLLTSFLAILKLGGVYVPIDLKFPDERVKHIKRDCKCKVVIDFDLFESFEKDNQDFGKLKEVAVAPNDLAYIIYTSGSTGKPKGVMIEHSNLLNLCYWHIDNYKVTSKSKGTMFSGVAFDASIWEFAPYLLCGAALYPIAEEEVRLDINKLHQFFEDNQITHCYLPTQVCQTFIEKNKKIEHLTILTGGESLKLIEDTEMNIHNNYGPTESTIITTHFNVKNNFRRPIPIGKPIANTRVYILNDNFHLQPLGVPGKLYISGAGVARGYLNMDELTKSKFIHNPFDPTTKMYDSGDLARWLPDGNIEFMGRSDSQVKIRGYRIELEEVENIILQYSTSIKQSIVTVKNVIEDEKLLIGYYHADEEIDHALLRNYLDKRLPFYMIPSHFIALKEVPITLNGKVDKKALPDINSNEIRTGEYISPRNYTEEKLSQIWAEVLKLDKVGVKNNFFELGGHSLKLELVKNLIAERLKKQVSYSVLFQNTTIERLAESIEKNVVSGPEDEGIQPSKINKKYLASPVQQRIYFLSKLTNYEVDPYSISIAFQILGDLDKKRLSDAIQTVVNRHEALRTSFVAENAGLYQEVKEEVHFNLDILSEGEHSEEIINLFSRKSFDLNKSPLYKFLLIEKATKEYILCLNIHHIICDGLSISIIFNEIMALYNEKTLPELKWQYKDFSEWINNQRMAAIYNEHREYWLKKLDGYKAERIIPIDFHESKVGTGTRCIQISLDAKLSSELKEICITHSFTMFNLLMGIFKISLLKSFPLNDIVVGTDLAGRIIPGSERVVGMFINNLIIRTSVLEKDNVTFLDFISNLRSTVIEALDHQVFQLSDLTSEFLKFQRRTRNENPLFQIMFSFSNKNMFPSYTLKDLEVLPLIGKVNNQAKFELIVTVLEQDSNITIELEYNPFLFKLTTISTLADIYEKVIRFSSTAIRERYSIQEVLHSVQI